MSITWYGPTAQERLELIASKPFARMSYTEAVEVLCPFFFRDCQSEKKNLYAENGIGIFTYIYHKLKPNGPVNIPKKRSQSIWDTLFCLRRKPSKVRILDPSNSPNNVWVWEKNRLSDACFFVLFFLRSIVGLNFVRSQHIWFTPKHSLADRVGLLGCSRNLVNGL